MLNFLLRSKWGRLIVHAILSVYEVLGDFVPEVVMGMAEGKTISWKDILLSPILFYAIVANFLFYFLAQSVKQQDSQEVQLYSMDYIQNYITESGKIALEQQAQGEIRAAKSTIRMQERYIGKIRREKNIMENSTDTTKNASGG